MLTPFDWLRRCSSGAELMATMRLLGESGLTEPSEATFLELGSPYSALDGPCQRCWVYARPQAHNRYCDFCYKVEQRSKVLGHASRQTVLVWGFVNELPRHMEARSGFYRDKVMAVYPLDSRRFLLAVKRHQLKEWLQELVLYHGLDLKGLLQIFPTMAAMDSMNMGEALAQIAQREANFSVDRLRVQFYAAPAQIRRFSSRNQQGQLTFEISEFLRLLELAAIFRTLLKPDEQQFLYQLLQVEDTGEAQFYWGRFLGQINQEVRDMLNAWQIRRWPKHQVDLLYELIEYVAFYQTH